MLHDCDCQSPRAAESFTTRFTPAFYSKAAAQPQGFLRPGGEKLKSGPQRRQGEAQAQRKVSCGLSRPLGRSLPSFSYCPSLLSGPGLHCSCSPVQHTWKSPWMSPHSQLPILSRTTSRPRLLFLAYVFINLLHLYVCVFICFPVLVFKEKEFMVEVFIFPVSQCEMPSMSWRRLVQSSWLGHVWEDLYEVLSCQ